MGNNTVIESDLRDFIIRKKVAEYVRCVYIDERIHMLFEFKEMRIVIHFYRSVFIFHNFSSLKMIIRAQEAYLTTPLTSGTAEKSAIPRIQS